jgi:copper oxidase (laccase) domain-containing protein
MNDSPFMSFQALADCPAFTHRFILRSPSVKVDGERAEVLQRLRPVHLASIRAMHFSATSFCEAEQVHQAGVAVVEAPGEGLAMGMDGLVSDSPDVVLGIYVADCCAVYLVDPVTKAFGLVHAGKKGAEGMIVTHAIELMNHRFGAKAEDIIVQLSPCIRPPNYEVDFAAQVRAQCLAAGISPEHLHDCGLCTASDLAQFYSYRIEKGRTGRMLAVLGRSRDAC